MERSQRRVEEGGFKGEVLETDLASSLNEFDPFTLGENEDEKELSRKQSINSGLIKGEKVYEFKV